MHNKLGNVDIASQFWRVRQNLNFDLRQHLVKHVGLRVKCLFLLSDFDRK
jgi:hypothetical protein